MPLCRYAAMPLCRYATVPAPRFIRTCFAMRPCGSSSRDQVAFLDGARSLYERTKLDPVAQADASILRIVVARYRGAVRGWEVDDHNVCRLADQCREAALLHGSGQRDRGVIRAG
jgi:hypothetical protein